MKLRKCDEKPLQRSQVMMSVGQGYPQTSYDQLKEDGYKERGNGPDFKVIGDKGETRLSNLLQNVQLVENDPRVFVPQSMESK